MSVKLYGWPSYLSFREAVQDSSRNNGIKLSVVIPTLNQAETLEHTLLSIINQDYMNFELIIVDGGSHDHTSSIIEKYRSWISCYISGKDKGQSDAINKGFDVATGQIFSWINSDDFYLPLAFRRISKFFDRNKEIDVVLGSGDVVTKECKFLKHINPMPMKRAHLLKWLEGRWIMQQSCFWTDKIWKSSGGVDQSLKLLMDFDLWLRFAGRAKSATINESLSAMRYYPEIKTVSLRDLVKEETAYVLAKNQEFEEVRKMVRKLAKENKVLLNRRDKQKHFLSRRLPLRIELNS
jgi:glycosyltransferase involved in cell wall biosynthesis